jgi:hypothetical protein
VDAGVFSDEVSGQADTDMAVAAAAFEFVEDVARLGALRKGNGVRGVLKAAASGGGCGFPKIIKLASVNALHNLSNPLLTAM